MKAKGLMRAKGLLIALTLVAAAPALAGISGQYIEARSADVYTGPCFANSEVNLTGQEAVLAWHVDKGTWGDVSLDDRSVIAVVRASATLGDPFANPLPAKTVFIVDARASQAQRAALVNFAQAQSGGLLNDVLAVESSPIQFESEMGGRHGYAMVDASNLARVTTRAIGDADHLCHNEEVYYPPLAAHLSHAMPVVTASSSYAGNHLGVHWTDSGRRGSFVGTFAF